MKSNLASASAVIFALSACSLELSDKLACNTDDDCIGSRVCARGTCRAPGAAEEPENSDKIPVSGGPAPRAPSAGGSSAAADPSAGDVALGGAGAASVAAGLVALEPSNGVLEPSFDPSVRDYSLELSDVASELSLTPAISKGARVTLLEEQLVSGVASAPLALSTDSDRIELVVQMAEAQPKTYTVSVHRSLGVSAKVMKPLEAPGGSIFGASVAVDGATLAVANFEAVDVFRATGAGYELEAHITPDGGQSDDSFGTSLALEGDRLVVGASREDSDARGIDGDRDNDAAPESGAAYVYVREGGKWREEAFLKASNTRYWEGFGESVALRGNSIAVGAPFERSGAIGVDGDQGNDDRPHSGAVYLFELGDDGWRQTHYVKTAQDVDGNHNAQFGWNVALTDDLLVVAAPLEDVSWFGALTEQATESMSSAGAVYVLGRDGDSWQHLQRLQASNAERDDGFGLGLALGGNLLAVGAPHEDGGAAGVNGNQLSNLRQNSGAVYLFERTEQGFVQRAYLKPKQPELGGYFGFSVALRGATLAVGEWAESRRDGSAYLFGLADGRWSQQLRVDARTARGDVPDDAMPDNFGWSLALSERSLFVGAPYERPYVGETGIGATYCFK